MTRTAILLLAWISNVPVFCMAADDAVNWPKKVLIVRHGEKNADADLTGDLSVQGRERAKALHKLFEKSAERSEPFAKPEFIFAGKDKNSSRRCSLMVAPLAESLKLTVNAKYSTDEPEKLAAEIFGHKKYAGKTILVCWRHSTMHALAVHLKVEHAPKEWKDTIFDRVWQIDYDNGKAKFQNLPQQLMPGDEKK